MSKRAKTTVSSWLSRSLVSVEELHDQSEVLELFSLADSLRNEKFCKKIDKNHGKIVALAFLEPSTRTMCSFSAAAQKLGCGVIHMNASDSSITKGETLSDSIKCLGSYADVIVLRSPQLGAALEASKATTKSIVNAGDGTGEHPTQALLDLYTIYHDAKGIVETCSKEKPLNVTFLGDAKNGRTVHSLSKLLAKILGDRVFLRYVTPTKELCMPVDIVAGLKEKGCEQEEYFEMSDDVLACTDVLYVTRVQKERFSNVQSYEDAMSKSFRVTLTVANKLKPTALIMHPLPRVDEIHTDVDANPRCAYFRQMENGMYVRQALLGKMMGLL